MSNNNSFPTMHLRVIPMVLTSLLVVLAACSDSSVGGLDTDSPGRETVQGASRSQVAVDNSSAANSADSQLEDSQPDESQLEDYEIFGLCQQSDKPSPTLRVDGVAADDPDGGLIARRRPDSDSAPVTVLAPGATGLIGTRACHDAADGGRWFELYVDGEYVWANGAYLATDDQTSTNRGHLYFAEVEGRYPTALHPVAVTFPTERDPLDFLLQSWLEGPNGESSLSPECEEAFTYTVTSAGHAVVHLCMSPTAGHFGDFLFTHSLETTLIQLPEVSAVSILSNGWCVGDEDTGLGCLDGLDACEYGVALGQGSRIVDAFHWNADGSTRPLASHVHDLSVDVGHACTTVTVEFGREPNDAELADLKADPWSAERLIVDEHFSSVVATPGTNFQVINGESGTTLVLGDDYNIDAFFGTQETSWHTPGRSSGTALVSIGSIDGSGGDVPVVWMSDGTTTAPSVAIRGTAIVFGFPNSATPGPSIVRSVVISSITEPTPGLLQIAGYGAFFEASGIATVWPKGGGGSGSPIASSLVRGGNPAVGWAPFSIQLPELEPGDYELGFTCDQCVEPDEFLSVTVRG